MEWPQLLYLGLIFLSLGLALGKHGEPQTGKHNFWAMSIGAIIQILILKAGGFFG